MPFCASLWLLAGIIQGRLPSAADPSNGQISIAVALGPNGGLRGDPDMRIQGVPVEEDRAAFIADALEAATEAVVAGGKDHERLREAIRLAVRRTATRWTGKKPIVDVLIVEA